MVQYVEQSLEHRNHYYKEMSNVCRTEMMVLFNDPANVTVLKVKGQIKIYFIGRSN